MTNVAVLLLGLILISLSLSVFTQLSFGEYVEVRLDVVSVNWGLKPGENLPVAPGDQNMPLTIIIQNLSENYTLNGIRASLWLKEPFYSPDGRKYVEAEYSVSPVQGVRIVGVPPGGSFPLTFRLSIRENASIGAYTLNLVINCKAAVYRVPSNENVTYYDAYSISLPVRIYIPGKSEVIIDAPISSLTAGRNNTVVIKIVNEGTAPISRIKASLIAPPKTAVFGRDEWFLHTLENKSSISLSTVMYVSKDLAGRIISVPFAVSYINNLGQSETLLKNLTFAVYGYVDVNVFGTIVSPQVATNGSKVVFSANLLNKGITTAKYVNASIIPSGPIIATYESTSYIGDLEPNTVMPFSLTFEVSESAKEGIYPVKVKIEYLDAKDILREITIQKELQVIIAEEKKGSETFLLLPFNSTLLYLILLIVAIAVVCLVYGKLRK